MSAPAPAPPQSQPEEDLTYIDRFGLSRSFPSTVTTLHLALRRAPHATSSSGGLLEHMDPELGHIIFVDPTPSKFDCDQRGLKLHVPSIVVVVPSTDADRALPELPARCWYSPAGDLTEANWPNEQQVVRVDAKTWKRLVAEASDDGMVERWR